MDAHKTISDQALTRTPRGSLLDALQRRRSWHQTFSEEQLWYYVNQIAEGLAALHREGLFHGALKVTSLIILAHFRFENTFYAYGLPLYDVHASVIILLYLALE